MLVQLDTIQVTFWRSKFMVTGGTCC